MHQWEDSENEEEESEAVSESEDESIESVYTQVKKVGILFTFLYH